MCSSDLDSRNTATDLQAKAWVMSAGPAGRAWAAIEPRAACPGDEPGPWWKPASLPRSCRLSGPDPEDAEPDPAFSALDDRDRPVSGAALPSCVAALAPQGLCNGISLRFWAEEGPGGLASTTLRFEGDTAARLALSDWLQGLRDRLRPGHPVPGLEESVLGAILAWSEGDLEVQQEEGATVVTLSTLPLRAERMMEHLAAGAVSTCGPRDAGGER